LEHEDEHEHDYEDEQEDEPQNEPALCLRYPIVMLYFIEHAIHSTTKTTQHPFYYTNSNVFRGNLKIKSASKASIESRKNWYASICIV
jgi:hypothetical protein